MENTLMITMLAVLSVFALAVLVRAVIGPRFTDRIVAVNAVNTIIIAVICVLSVYLGQDFLLDIALIYALLGFVANTLLMRNLYAKKKGEEKE